MDGSNGDVVASLPGAQVRRRSRTAAPAAEEPDQSQQAQKPLQPKVSSRLISSGWSFGALAVVLFLLCAFELDHLSWTQKLPLIPSFSTRPDRHPLVVAEPELANGAKLEILLNPQNHIYRESNLLEFDWVVTSAFRRPDGVRKRVYLVNDEFPGPTIECRSGDTLRIHVRNDLDASEHIGIHWHGLHMKHANDMDGAIGLTQAPISPGSNFTYEFRISDGQHGTFWYHAHDQVQRADGLLGGLIVHQPANIGRDLAGHGIPAYDEEKLFLIGDWYHRSASEVLAWYMSIASFGNEPVPDSMLVNYAGRYECSLAVPSRPVDCVQGQLEDLEAVQVNPEKTYRFRVINTGTLAGFTISIPGASISPFQIDGGNHIDNNGSVESVGVLYPGERVDFIVSWPRSLNNTTAWLGIELDEENFRYSNPALDYYQLFPISINGGGSGPIKPPPAPDLTANRPTFSLVNATSSNASGFLPLQHATITHVLYTTTEKLSRLGNIPHGFMNRTTWKPQSPALLALPRSKWDRHQLVPFIESTPHDPKWVDVVLNNLDDGSHPFHLHGHDFWILAISSETSYWGSYNPFDAPRGPPGGPFNLHNPVKKDTVFVPSRGYAVIRFLADNEGIHMFHCHVLWHQASGMAMAFQVGPSEEEAQRVPMMDTLRLSNLGQLKESCC